MFMSWIFLASVFVTYSSEILSEKFGSSQQNEGSMKATSHKTMTTGTEDQKRLTGMELQSMLTGNVHATVPQCFTVDFISDVDNPPLPHHVCEKQKQILY